MGLSRVYCYRTTRGYAGCSAGKVSVAHGEYPNLTLTGPFLTSWRVCCRSTPDYSHPFDSKPLAMSTHGDTPTALRAEGATYHPPGLAKADLQRQEEVR